MNPGGRRVGSFGSALLGSQGVKEESLAAHFSPGRWKPLAAHFSATGGVEEVGGVMGEGRASTPGLARGGNLETLNCRTQNNDNFKA